jgi:type IV pilus assembly protein PilX
MLRSSQLPALTASPNYSQRGVVLVITILLVIILALVGTFAIRNAAQSEKIMNGLRTTNVAQEAAETALRYCEQIAIADANGTDYTSYSTSGAIAKIIGNKTTKVDLMTEENDTLAKWKTAANWKSSSANLISVTPDFYKYSTATTGNDATELINSPACLIQRLLTGTGVSGYVITARGFANNATFDSNNKVTAGSEVWLQSVLTNN